MTAAGLMWRCARCVTTRRISCTDQRISGGTWRIIVRLLFGGVAVLALRRIAASIAKASMRSETCRCQPCQACPGESREAGLVVVEAEFVPARLEAQRRRYQSRLVVHDQGRPHQAP